MTEALAWQIGQRQIEALPLGELDLDGRGILWMFEPPRENATYFLAADPTVGRTGWNRWARTDDDMAIDNAAIEVVRKGKDYDVQVAEYAAPVDAVDFAPICNAIGRLYKGNDEEGMAPMIVEATGPGAVTIRELIDRFGYTNQFLWHYYGGALAPKAAGQGNKVGWYSSRSANKDLWMRGTHHIHNRKVKLYSKYLIEEMADCLADSFTLIGEARHGRHDDRVFAMLLALWMAHGWSTGVTDDAVEARIVQPAQMLEAQECDLDYDEMVSNWNERVSDLRG